MVIGRKLLMVSISVYAVDLQVRALVALLLCVLAILFHLHFSPFENKFLDLLEGFSLLVSFITFFGGQFLFTPISTWQKNIVSITIVSANLILVVAFVVIFLYSGSKSWLKTAKTLAHKAAVKLHKHDHSPDEIESGADNKHDVNVVDKQEMQPMISVYSQRRGEQQIDNDTSNVGETSELHDHPTAAASAAVQRNDDIALTVQADAISEALAQHDNDIERVDDSVGNADTTRPAPSLEQGLQQPTQQQSKLQQSQQQIPEQQPLSAISLEPSSAPTVVPVFIPPPVDVVHVQQAPAFLTFSDSDDDDVSSMIVVPSPISQHSASDENLAAQAEADAVRRKRQELNIQSAQRDQPATAVPLHEVASDIELPAKMMSYDSEPETEPFL
jgi:hypothetical protein